MVTIDVNMNDNLLLSYAVIDPLTMMIKLLHALIAYVAVSRVMRTNYFTTWA
jgi:hypothetical protein